MSKRNKKRIGTILGVVACILLLTFLVPIILNYDSFFGEDSIPDDNQVPGENQAPDDNNVDVNRPEDSISKVKVYFNDMEVKSGSTVESINSEVTFFIFSEEDYEASFVLVEDFQEFEYQINESYYRFAPTVNVLDYSISEGKATINMPFDIIDWLLLLNDGVSKEQLNLPTNLNHDVPYIALQVVVGDDIYIYPIKFNLNGVWTKPNLDKNEIVFCG